MPFSDGTCSTSRTFNLRPRHRIQTWKVTQGLSNIFPHMNARGVKQFLGLVGYYRKFIPYFTEVAKPLTYLTRKDKMYKWTTQCQDSFDLLKQSFMNKPVLHYQHQSEAYTLFTDASKYAWTCMLMQNLEHKLDGMKVVIHHPINYWSGLFYVKPVNFAALTK